MYVIGTAGHVDHGKSALVQALTGIDPDRLREEKERGMTIDLGFAWLTLPDGQDVSVIDVPGHERFIKNMLAGVGGIDAGLLVIAADEGIMPQTEEHLSILELLQIPSCLIAVTKVDLVDEDWLGLVHDDITERMKRSRYAEAPMVDVSVVDSRGLDQLVAQVQSALVKSESRPDLGQPRLPIDRVFTVAGFGTVVTGTLTGGSITVGQELVVQPGGRKTRVRGMQAHKTMVLQAMPGTRVAVNVAGVAVEELKRGQVLTTAGWLAPSLAVDVWLQVIESAPGPLKHNAPVTFHVGASEVAGIVKLLDADALAARQAGWAQIKLAEPVLVARHDHFVVRFNDQTVAGGTVVDTNARRHRRGNAATLATLDRMLNGTPEDGVIELVRRRGSIDRSSLLQTSSLAAADAARAVENLLAEGRLVSFTDLLLAAEDFQKHKSRLEDTLRDYHRQYPLRAGMRQEELRSRLNLTAEIFNLVLAELIEERLVVERGTAVKLSRHEIRFTAAQAKSVDYLLKRLAEGGYSPPALDQLCVELELDDDTIAALVQRGDLVRTSVSVAFAKPVYDDMVAQLRQWFASHPTITVAEWRDLTGTSRKFGLAFLEYLDQQRVTRRVGDVRQLR